MEESSDEGPPASGSIDELVAYFETHDMGDDLDQMPEVELDVVLERRTGADHHATSRLRLPA